jgi:Flp pilus assembly protein TadG
MRRQESHNGKRGGQSIVELALMMPVMVLLVLGIVDLGRVFFAYTAVINAAREGARYGAMNPTDTAGIRTHAEQEAQGTGLALVAANPECLNPGSTCASGTSSYPIRVTVTFDFHLLTIQIFGTGTIHLTASAQMVVF